MQSFILFAFRIFIAFVLGLFFAVYIMQNDEYFKEIAQQGLGHVFGIFFDCKVEGTIHSFAILVPSPYIVTTQIKVTPKKGNDWQWACERFILSFSWLDIIFGSNIGIKSDIQKLHATSGMHENRPCIMEHFDKIINTQQDLPFELRKLHVNKGNFVIYNEKDSFKASCAFDCDVGNFNKRLQTIFYITDGVLRAQSRTFIADANLRISCDVMENDIKTLFTGMLYMPAIDQTIPNYIQGYWKQNCGSIRIYNKSGSFVVDRCTVKQSEEGFTFGAMLHVPLNYMQKLIVDDPAINTLQGNCSIQLQGNLHNQPTIDSKIHIQDIVYKEHFLGELEADISYAQETVQGFFVGKSELAGNPKGTLRWSLQEKKGNFEISNATSIEHLPIRYWRIAPNGISIIGILNSFTSLSTSYTCNVTHTKLETTHTLQGQAIINSDDISIKGKVDSLNYECNADRLHNFYVKKFNLDKENKNIVTLNSNDTHIESTFSYDCVRSLAKQLFNYDLQGNGVIKLQSTLEDKKIITDFSMKKGNIRLGTTYNFIQNLLGHLEVETEKQDFILRNCCINLHRGRLLIPYARCLYNTQLKQIEYCYLPIHLQNVFLNSQKDVFMMASGRVVVEQNGKKPIIKGNIVIDRGQIRQNIFSAKEQKSILQALSQTLLGSSADVEFDITVDTKHPIYVRTGFLESEIKVQLSIKGSLQHPHVSGKIFINDGIFHFPYRPLYITSGILYIMPHNIDDPAIELHAKGKIKRYTINMQVHGTLLDTHITFASTPPLSQEQIITLLLGGSETGSLSFVMPSLVMQNVRGLIFDSEQMSPSFKRYVLSPLRYIRIVPSFVDQTGRGGFRGAIEIDISDQLRAVIQKNFSLSEDTRFEVEYQVSDEISLRGLKDERSDIGGEIEMRFTF